MSLIAIDITEVKSGRAGRTKGEKYGKYAATVPRILPDIEALIDASKDGKVRLKNSDVAREMGADYAKKNSTSIYWGLKFVLFSHGIYVDTGTHTSGEKLLVMRRATKEDKLPPSLAKYLEVDEEDMPEPGHEEEEGPEDEGKVEGQ